MRPSLLTLLILGAASTAAAQTTWRIDLYRQQQHFKDFQQEAFFGYGFDEMVTDRTSVGAGINLAWSSLAGASSSSGSYETARWNGYTIDYALGRSVVNLDFRSDFGLAPVDRFHAFIGTTAGLSWVRAKVATSSVTAPGALYVDRTDLGLDYEYKKASLTFPLGARFGIRGSMDGGHVELYGGYGVYLGPQAIDVGAKYLGKGVALSSTFLQFGIAVSFG